MVHLLKSTPFYLMFLFLFSFSITSIAQDMVSYAYDNAGNRISRKIVPLNSNPTHAKKTVEDQLPIVEQLGERKIAIYPNPTKGALAVEITGGNDKDALRIVLLSAQGIQLQTLKAEIGKTPVDMHLHPSGWYILRITVGEKVTEFKIIKQ